MQQAQPQQEIILHPMSGEPAIYAARETLIFAATMGLMTWALDTQKALKVGLVASSVIAIPIALSTRTEYHSSLPKMVWPTAYTSEGHVWCGTKALMKALFWTGVTKLFNHSIRDIVTVGKAFAGALFLPRLWIHSGMIETKLYNNDPEMPEQIERAYERACVTAVFGEVVAWFLF